MRGTVEYRLHRNESWNCVSRYLFKRLGVDAEKRGCWTEPCGTPQVSGRDDEVCPAQETTSYASNCPPTASAVLSIVLVFIMLYTPVPRVPLIVYQLLLQRSPSCLSLIWSLFLYLECLKLSTRCVFSAKCRLPRDCLSTFEFSIHSWKLRSNSAVLRCDSGPNWLKKNIVRN